MRLTHLAASAVTAAASLSALPAVASTSPTAALPADLVLPTETPIADAQPIDRSAVTPANPTIAAPEVVARAPERVPEVAASQPMAAPASVKSTDLTVETLADPIVPQPVLQASASVIPEPQAIAKAAPQPIAKPATKPATQPATKPLAKPAAKPTPQPIQQTVSQVNILGVDTELKEIAQRVILTKAGDVVNPAVVEEDIAALLETGLFSSATVSSKTNFRITTYDFKLAPVIARSIELTDAKALPQDVVNQIFKPQLSQAVKPTLLNQGVRDVQKWYEDNGYNLARVAGLNVTREGVLKLAVTEGNVGEIKIRFVDENGLAQDEKGNPVKGRTQDRFIREFIKTQPGSAFKESAAQEDLNRLMRSGLFMGGRVSLEGDLRNATVVYNLAEQPLRRSNIGGGYSSDAGLYGNVSYSDFNFGGLGQQIGGNVILGSKDFQFDGRFANPYREIKPGTWGYSLQASRSRGLSRVFDGDVKLATGDDVREGRFGGGVTFNKPIGTDWNANVGVNYTRVSARDTQGNLVKTDAAGKPLSLSGTGLDDLYSATVSLSQDKRDNVLDPKSGSVLSLSTEQFVPIGVGSILANRVSANYSQYIPVNLFGQKDGKPQDTFAFNIQGGTTIGDLPPSQAYLLGGVNSVRGFEQGKVGIGKSYAQATAEYRFPIWNDTVGGTLFADYGTDLGSSSGVLGAPGVQRGRSGSGFGYGAGVRVNVPVVGMLRADWGFNDRGENRIQFGIGQKF